MTFVEHLRTATSEKQQTYYRFNIKNGVTENPFNYSPEKCSNKYVQQNSNKCVQSFYKIVILQNFEKFKIQKTVLEPFFK